jgi:hypothetical protein
MNPALQYADPPDRFTGMDPPTDFLEKLHGINQNLCMLWDIEKNKWLLAEVRTVTLRRHTGLLSRDGSALRTDGGTRKVAIGFGWAHPSELNNTLIDAIKRYSPALKPGGWKQAREEDHERATKIQESAHRDMVNASESRLEVVREAVRVYDDEVGVPLSSVEDESRVAEEAEKGVDALRQDFLRQIVPV